MELFWILGVLLSANQLKLSTSSLYFDGLTAQVAVVENTTLLNGIGTSNFTLHSWFRVDNSSGSGYDSILSNRGCSCFKGFMYGFQYSAGNTPFIQIVQNTLPDDTSIAYNDNKWHNFIVTKQSTILTMYLDTQIISTTEYSDLDTYNISSNHSLWFGRDRGSSNQYVGYIDDIAIWDRALNINEINYLYQSSLLSNCTMLYLDDSLIHYWPLNEAIDGGEYLEDVANGFNAIVGLSSSDNTWDPEISSEEPNYSDGGITINDKCITPTASPTLLPSIVPTIMPTTIPTSIPTILPTTEPSKEPTDSTNPPTNQPSGQPSNQPTSLPTTSPTTIFAPPDTTRTIDIDSGSTTNSQTQTQTQMTSSTRTTTVTTVDSTTVVGNNQNTTNLNISNVNTNLATTTLVTDDLNGSTIIQTQEEGMKRFVVVFFDGF